MNARPVKKEEKRGCRKKSRRRFGAPFHVSERKKTEGRGESLSFIPNGGKKKGGKRANAGVGLVCHSRSKEGREKKGRIDAVKREKNSERVAHLRRLPIPAVFEKREEVEGLLHRLA